MKWLYCSHPVSVGLTCQVTVSLDIWEIFTTCQRCNIPQKLFELFFLFLSFLAHSPRQWLHHQPTNPQDSCSIPLILCQLTCIRCLFCILQASLQPILPRYTRIMPPRPLLQVTWRQRLSLLHHLEFMLRTRSVRSKLDSFSILLKGWESMLVLAFHGDVGSSGQDFHSLLLVYVEHKHCSSGNLTWGLLLFMLETWTKFTFLKIL